MSGPSGKAQSGQPDARTSSFSVLRENVIFCLHDRVAREPALGRPAPSYPGSTGSFSGSNGLPPSRLRWCQFTQPPQVNPMNDLTTEDHARLNSGINMVLQKETFSPTTLIECVRKVVAKSRLPQKIPEIAS
jgi:hypothetical protein